MKKNYIAPTLQMIPVNMTQLICTSIKTNVEYVYNGGTPDDFDEDHMRSREFDLTPYSSVWNEYDEEEEEY